MAELNLDSFWDNIDTKCTLSSDVPSDVGSRECFLGIDEAGRGPVLGPMVYGASYCPISMKDQLKHMGFAGNWSACELWQWEAFKEVLNFNPHYNKVKVCGLDGNTFILMLITYSKTLSEASREKYFDTINCSTHLGWIVEILSPNYISNLMLRRTKYNLNSISHDSAAGLINKLLERNVNITEVYVDTVGDPTKYQTLLSSKFPHIKITVSAKADSLFPIVSCASICAKVARDHVVFNWKFQEMDHSSSNEEFGSGYPADPITKQWLASNTDHVFGFPSLVRFSWSTAANILASEALPVHWEDDEDTSGSAKITQFFSSKRNPTTQNNMHRYFRERNLKFVTSL